MYTVLQVHLTIASILIISVMLNVILVRYEPKYINSSVTLAFTHRVYEVRHLQEQDSGLGCWDIT